MRIGVMMRYRRDPVPRLEGVVQNRLDRLFKSGKVKAADFDSRVFELLGSLPPPAAIQAIDRFQSKLTDDVRNISAFFTSMLRQVGVVRLFVAHPKTLHCCVVLQICQSISIYENYSLI